MNDTQQEWLTRTEAAERLGVNVLTLDRWVRAGLLTRYKVRVNESRFHAADIAALMVPRADLHPMVQILSRIRERSTHLTVAEADALLVAEKALMRLTTMEG